MATSFPSGPGSSALRRGRYSLERQVYLVTFTTYERRRLFTDFHRAASACAALHRVATHADAHVSAWVLMPDHAHLLVAPGPSESLSRWVGRGKSAMSRAVRGVDHRVGPIWDHGFHDHALRFDESLREAARYLAFNPVRAGLVKRPLDYPYWFAAWL